MERISDDLLRSMGRLLSEHDRDEMAIPSYLHRNPLLRRMAWLRVRVVAERLAELAKPRVSCVVDFGCGAGVLLPDCQRWARRVFAVDRQLEAARWLLEQRPLENVRLVHSDECESAIEPGSVDIVIAAEVLEHIEPLGPVLDSFRRWLKPSARLLVSLPTENLCYRLGRRAAGFHGHYHKQNARTVDAAIRGAGFRRTRRRQLPAPGPLAIYWVCEYQR